GSPRRRVDADGRLLAQSLVRPFLVVVTREGNEATVLVSPISRRRPHGLQKRQMEALVPTVLLRLTGVDPFMPDAQLDPPGRQHRQPGRPGRGERRAVVGTDHLRQAIVAESPLKERFRLFVRRTVTLIKNRLNPSVIVNGSAREPSRKRTQPL